MWLGIGWLFCNLFQVPELWADFRGFLGANSSQRLGQSEWFSGQGSLGTGKPFQWPALWKGGKRACLTATMTSFLTDTTTVHLQSISPSARIFSLSTLFHYYSNYVKQLRYTKVSYSLFYWVEVYRISNFIEFQNSVFELWSKARCTVHYKGGAWPNRRCTGKEIGHIWAQPLICSLIADK